MMQQSRMNRAGLCSTCNNAASCMYRANRGFDALYCEMFDSYSPPLERMVGCCSMKSVEKPSNTDVGVPVAEKHRGLCMNCSYLEDCALPKPNGGVWHCEEYC